MKKVLLFMMLLLSMSAYCQEIDTIDAKEPTEQDFVTKFKNMPIKSIQNECRSLMETCSEYATKAMAGIKRSINCMMLDSNLYHSDEFITFCHNEFTQSMNEHDEYEKTHPLQNISKDLEYVLGYKGKNKTPMFISKAARVAKYFDYNSTRFIVVNSLTEQLYEHFMERWSKD